MLCIIPQRLFTCMCRVHSGKESTSGWRANWLYIVFILSDYTFRNKLSLSMFVVLICEPSNPTSLYPKSSKTISKTCGGTAITWSTNNENDENRTARIRRKVEPLFVTFLFFALFSIEAKCQQMRSDFLNSIPFSATRSALQGHAC